MRAEIRTAIRSLLREAGLCVAAILCLALGIGGTTIVYSVTSALVLHPVPATNPNGLVVVTEVAPSSPRADQLMMAPANYVDLGRRNRSFSALAAFTGIDANLTGIDQPERVTGFRVTPSYFQILGIAPALGRTFSDDEARYTSSPNVVILSDGLWRRRFGADPSVVGRTLQLNSVPRTIVGVMPPGFMFPSGAELWTPLSTSDAFGRDRDGRTLKGVIGRLRSGITVAQANDDVRAIMRQLATEYPGDDAKWSMRVEDANAFFGQHPRPYMLAQLAAIALVLLIACANVANLLLARATTRATEIAVRVALGASRMRIVRQQLIEALLLGLTGGTLGALLAVWGVTAIRTLLSAEQVRLNPGWTRMEVDGGVLLFTAALSVITALIVGAAPALIASGADPQQALSDGGRTTTSSGARTRLRGVLVATEMALALTMVAGTFVTVRGFRSLANEASGYRIEHALTMQLTAPFARYATTADAERMYANVLARVKTEPGVVNAAYTTALPPEWTDYTARIFIEGERRPTRSEPAHTPRWRMITPEFFATMGIPLLQGRSFSAQDDSTSPSVIVISQSMARSFWPHESAIGKRIGCACDDTTMSTVIGVVGDVRYNPNVASAELPTYYVATAQAHPWRSMSLVIRTRDDPAAMTRRLIAAVTSAAPAVAPGGVASLERLHDMSLSPQRLTSAMMGGFALIAIVLATIGIHGVMSYTVARRTHDIGVRTALGAQRSDILATILRSTIRPVMVGVGVGVIGAVLMTRVLAHLLTQLAPNDPLAFGASVILLVLAAAAGTYLPARRAVRVDPLVALRS